MTSTTTLQIVFPEEVAQRLQDHREGASQMTYFDLIQDYEQYGREDVALETPLSLDDFISYLEYGHGATMDEIHTKVMTKR